jgi:hypothetical protein
MNKEEFHKLLLCGFDVEFDYKEAFYSITTFEENGKIKFSVANNKNWCIELDTIEEVDSTLIEGQTLLKIIESLQNDAICY